MLEGASPDDARVLREALTGRLKGETGKKGINPDDVLSRRLARWRLPLPQPDAAQLL
jgi:hypothetical protein